MWLDERGTMHTCAFADAEEAGVIDVDLADDLRRLASEDEEALGDAIERFFDRAAEEVDWPHDPQTERRFVEEWLPPGHLVGRARTLAELERLLGTIEPRWRLDAIGVVEHVALR